MRLYIDWKYMSKIWSIFFFYVFIFCVRIFWEMEDNGMFTYDYFGKFLFVYF